MGAVRVLPASGLQAAWLCCRCRTRRQSPLAPSRPPPGVFWVLCLRGTLVTSRCHPHVASICPGPSNDVSLPLAGPVRIHKGLPTPRVSRSLYQDPGKKPFRSWAMRVTLEASCQSPRGTGAATSLKFHRQQGRAVLQAVTWAGRAFLIPSLDAAAGKFNLELLFIHNSSTSQHLLAASEELKAADAQAFAGGTMRAH